MIVLCGQIKCIWVWELATSGRHGLNVLNCVLQHQCLTENIYCLASAASLSFHDCRCILITIFSPSISFLEPVEENLDSAGGLGIVYVVNHSLVETWLF